MLASWYAYSASSDPDKLPYDLSFWRAGASVAGTALSAWLAHRRSPAALPAAAATAAGTLLLGALNKRRSGSYVRPTWSKDKLREKVFNHAMPVAHAVGSAALVGVAACAEHARRIRGAATLSGPLLSAPWYPTARKLGLYFISFSMVGHWAETLFCTGIKHGLIRGEYDRSNHMLWDQWLFPFPAEGSAAVLADLVLTPVKNKLQSATERAASSGIIPQPLAFPITLGASFLANQVVCTSIDYTTGMVANRNYELWDYRDMPFNFRGQICLQNSLFYSTVATWGVWWLLPQLEKVMERAGDTKLDGLLVGMGSVFIFLELLYQVLPKDLFGDVPDSDDAEQQIDAEALTE